MDVGNEQEIIHSRNRCTSCSEGRATDAVLRQLEKALAERDMQLDYVRSAIERMRTQVGRQLREIFQLQRAGIPTASAEVQRMLDKIDSLCAEREN
jgi:hypothetical protein